MIKGMRLFTKRTGLLALGLLFQCLTMPVQAVVPPLCQTLYEGTGAVPVGPSATPEALQRCINRAMSAHVTLGNYYCLSANGRRYAEEYCGTPAPDEPDEDREQGDDCDGEGNPCSPGSGNKYQRESDYRSANGYLDITRHYNSLIPRDRGLGFGWTSALSRRIVFESLALDRLTVRLASGRGERWNRVGTVWQSYSDTRLRLVETASGFTVTHPDATIEEYDPTGKLLTATDRQGLSTRYDYDSAGRLMQVTDPFGRSLTLTYNTNNQISRITTPDGDLQYGYDGQANLTSVTYPDGSGKIYHYENPNLPHHLTGITDENGARFATWSYASTGKVIASEHAGGAERVTLQYSADGSQTTVTGVLGDTRTYAFQLLQGVNKVVSVSGDRCGSCSRGHMQARTYDANGFLAGYTDWNGQQTRFVNNNRGLVETRVEAVGTPDERTTQTQWHPDFDLPVSIEAPGQRTRMSYSGTGQLLSRTLEDTATGQSRTTTYTYHASGTDGAGLLAGVDGPRTDIEDITRFDYDSQGNLTRVTNALGQVTRITAHDASGRPLTLIDPNGVQTDLRYDGRGRLIEQHQAGSATGYSYDAAGQLTRVTLADGAYLNYAYDAAHRLIGMSDNAGNRIGYTLDAMGNRTQTEVLDAEGTLVQQQRSVFDALSRITQQLGANNQTTAFQYDNNDNPVQLREEGDTGPVSTGQAYDALNRLRRITDPLTNNIDLDYDDRDNLTQVTDTRGLTTAYTVDGFGQRSQQVSPDTGTTQYRYDSAGNLIEQIDANGVVTQYNYDALNRLLQTHYPQRPAQDVSYRYDQGVNGQGRLTSVTDESGQTDLAYDVRGNRVRVTHTRNGEAMTLQYGYDQANRLIQVIYPDGRILHYQRDTLGRITRVTTQANGAAPEVLLVGDLLYRPFGPNTALTYGNGAQRQRDYDLDGRLTRIQTALGPRLLQDLSYGYDRRDDIIQLSDAVTAANSQQLGYDALQRLTQAQGAYGEQAFSYDAVGNRTELDDNGATTTYVPAADSNRLFLIDGQRQNYRRNGSPLYLRGLRIRYGINGRISALVRGATTVGAYRYDGFGQRREKVAGTTLTRYGYGPTGELLYERTGTETTNYMYLDGELVAMTQSNSATPATAAVYYIHTDHLGTPQVVTDAAGEQVWSATYAPFGEATVDASSTVTLNVRFPGQYYDAESGLHYNYHRYYDPATGRYITSDPIGLDGGLNTYLYVNANPMKSIDPLGLNGFAAGWAANGGPYSGNGATLSGGVSGTVGSTTLGVNTSTSGVQWGQTTQLSLGIGLELCIIPEPVNEPNGCGVNQDDDNYPDNYSMGLGQNLGVTVRKDGAMCLNVGPSVGLPFGAGWDL